MVINASPWVDVSPKTVVFNTSSSKPPEGPSVSLELRFIPPHIPIKTGWKLASSLMIAIQIEGNHFIAKVPFLDEYGLGVTTEEAIDDLLTSLVDYNESLLRRESRLSEPLKRDLENLKKVLTK
jgi:hypothetical protein